MPRNKTRPPFIRITRAIVAGNPRNSAVARYYRAKNGINVLGSAIVSLHYRTLDASFRFSISPINARAERIDWGEFRNVEAAFSESNIEKCPVIPFLPATI